MTPTTVTTETETLLSYLTGQRRHVLGILEGLDDAALRRPVLPSGWSCLGLVHRWWTWSAVAAIAALFLLGVLTMTGVVGKTIVC